MFTVNNDTDDYSDKRRRNRLLLTPERLKNLVNPMAPVNVNTLSFTYNWIKTKTTHSVSRTTF